MTETVWLLVIFVLLNILDGFTTWLGVHKLPEGLRAREANPLLKDVEKSFWSAMIKKGAFVLFGVWFFYRFANIYALRVLDLAFAVVVLSNTYVYLARRLGNRRFRSPIEIATNALQRAHLPERAARLVSFYGLVGLLLVGCYLIVGAFS